MSDDRVPYSQDEADEAYVWVNGHGPANAWTGTAGTAARMIGRLLGERDRLLGEVVLWQAVASLQPEEHKHLEAAISEAEGNRKLWLRSILERLT